MSYINTTFFFEPTMARTRAGDKRLYFKARSKSGGAKAELFPIKLSNLTVREERTLMKYFKKIGFSCSTHVMRRSTKNNYSKKYRGKKM